ncbi:MAG TPA: CopG family antitoxin [Chloroflexia bacterium]|jgi:predicted DNA binding CopG/RHH family protein
MAKIPKFKNEQDEMEFWEAHDSTDYFEDTEETYLHLVGPRPRKTLISLRLDQEVIDRLKELASTQGLGYQTLARAWISERLMLETGFVGAQPYDQADVIYKNNVAVISADATARTRELIEQAVLGFPQIVSLYQQTLDSFASSLPSSYVATMLVPQVD